MVKEATLAVRTRAVCMIEAGIFINKVAKVVGISVRTIRRWLLRSKSGEPLQNRRGCGRKTSVTMVPKVVIAKTIGKKMKSTRVISQNLKSKGFSISHVTVHSYLRKNLKVRPYKPQVQPKLTEKQRTARIKFCNERKNWSIDSWRGFYSRTSPPLRYSTLQISKTTEFGRNLVPMFLLPKRSNFLEKSWSGV
ncbi:hypothetical protein LOD99_8587 [Oopsacas minuta]|uniref:Transposase Tc1-like domain-containing protein n=1 Tax=Oopsacas minuta TaxID=111878 RepID=A0AAV7JG14_9METZ|nr:hypothetical protein LOD99_8587 [Oopsacas minuta]